MRNRIYHALRRLEPYAKTDLIYLIKGGGWLSGAYAGSALLGMLRSILFANLLPAYVFGIYKYVTAAGDLLAGLSLNGLPLALTQMVARGNQGIVRYAVRLMFLSHLPFVVITLSVAAYYAYFDNYLLALSFIGIALFQPISASTNLVLAYLNGIKDFRIAAALSVVQNTALTIGIGLALLITDSAIVIILTALCIPAAVGVFQYIRLRATLPPEHDREAHKSLRTFSLDLSFMGFMTAVAEHIDKLLVFQLLGAAELAVYAFATLLPTQMKGLLKNIQPLLLPQYANRDPLTLKEGMAAKVWRMLLAATGMAGIYTILCPWVFALLFPQYTGAISLSQVYVWSLLGFIAVFPNTALIAHQHTRILLVCRSVSALIQIAGICIGIYFFGLWGAIITRILLKYADAVIYFVGYHAATHSVLPPHTRARA